MSKAALKASLAACKARAVTLAVASAQPMAQTARDRGGNENMCPPWIGPSHRAARQEQQGQEEHRDEAPQRRRKAHVRGKAARASGKKAAADFAPQQPCTGSRRCRLLAVSRSGDSEWRSRPRRAQAEPHPQGQDKGPRCCTPGRGPDGTRRITSLVAQAGWPGSRRRIGCVLAPAGPSTVVIYSGFGFKGRNVIAVRSADIVLLFVGGIGTLKGRHTPHHGSREKVATYMADGYARTAHRAGGCMAQNVGAANLAAGLQDAYLAGAPVIAITGRRTPMQQYRHSYQEIDHAPPFAAVTKYNVLVDSVEQLPLLLRQAFREATSGAPGPCTWISRDPLATS